jgi:hypothetical protein
LWALEHRRNTVYVPKIGRVFALAGAIAPSLMDFYLSRFLTDPSSAGSRSSDQNEEFAFTEISRAAED